MFFRGSTGAPRHYLGAPDRREQRYDGLEKYEPLRALSRKHKADPRGLVALFSELEGSLVDLGVADNSISPMEMVGSPLGQGVGQIRHAYVDVQPTQMPIHRFTV